MAGALAVHEAEAPTRGGAWGLTGWSGVGMVAAIVLNGPLSMAMQRTPSYWTAGAGDQIAAYLRHSANVDQMVIFFALSNLIFVFALGFFAGLRGVVAASPHADWVRGVVSIGTALFLAGGLLSETLSTGMAVVLRSTPDYQLDANSALLLQGLWATALAQGQVALGVVIVAVSTACLASGTLPRWVCWFGIGAGSIAVLRPSLVTHVPLFIASFQPVFLWIATISVVLLRMERRRSRSARRVPTPHSIASPSDVGP